MLAVCKAYELAAEHGLPAATSKVRHLRHAPSRRESHASSELAATNAPKLEQLLSGNELCLRFGHPGCKHAFCTLGQREIVYRGRTRIWKTAMMGGIVVARKSKSR